MTKGFESVFGGVTCLPGCFSIYRIKAPKGSSGYWVPILANPDICEHYSENVVDTLHKKNLLLLGEDRYLSTLMLRTFPKRKMVFCPQAVCKTIVPDTFRVLLSQRRRWINSTVHNLSELVLVRDLCGTFCFSMQFVVGMELIGTLVLPAAIAFTIYLCIVACIPSMPTPTLSLILLAFILGLPGLLIVITSRKLVYVGWMLIYLCSLPIWNFVLPAYAFWHFDDFSWGETRKIEGEKVETAHGDKEGVFDSSHIVMKRWVEFERERRWKSGQMSRDSYSDVHYRSSSPKSGGLTRDRYSMTSAGESFYGSGALGLDAGVGYPARPSQSLGTFSDYQIQQEAPLLSQPRAPFRGGRHSPASVESAGHYADRYRSNSGDVRGPDNHSIYSTGYGNIPSPGYPNSMTPSSPFAGQQTLHQAIPPPAQASARQYRRISLTDQGPVRDGSSPIQSVKRLPQKGRRTSTQGHHAFM